jgi:hypothetical protein
VIQLVFCGTLAAAVLTLVLVSYTFIGYDSFDSLGHNGVRFLFIWAPVVVGLASATVGMLWPDLIVRALGRLWDAIVGILQCI